MARARLLRSCPADFLIVAHSRQTIAPGRTARLGAFLSRFKLRQVKEEIDY